MGDQAGAFKATADRISGHWQDGSTFSYAYSRQAPPAPEALVIAMPEMGGEHTFVRRMN